MVITHIAAKKLQYKRRHTAINSNQDVDTSKDHIGSAGNLKEERCWVHQRGYGPPVHTNTEAYSRCPQSLEDKTWRHKVYSFWSSSPIEQQK